MYTFLKVAYQYHNFYGKYGKYGKSAKLKDGNVGKGGNDGKAEMVEILINTEIENDGKSHKTSR